MKYSSIGIIFFFLINNAYAINNSPSLSNLEILKESIIALNSTKEKSQKKQSQLNKNVNRSLYKDYGIFINYLSFRINSDCEQIIKRYGLAKIENLPCKGSQHQLDENNYATAEEESLGLDDELMQALGEFDEMLLEEEEMIAQTTSKKTNNQSGSERSEGGTGSDSDSGSQQFSENSQQNSENGKQSDTITSNNEMSGKNTSSTSEQNQSGKGSVNKSSKNTKRNRLDKIDDDIVARQLKEAAEAEKDPKLKEKLWDEYYRYKKNTIK